MRKNIDMMCLYWTTAGVIPGQAEISRFDFKDRVEAAARAGFKGIGLWHTDLEQILLQRSLQEMRLILENNGMQYLELEFLVDWFLEGARKVESDRRRQMLFEASAVLGAKHVKVGDFTNEKIPLPRVTESFAALCKEAERFGATIGFEVMGCAMIDNLPDAISMVENAGAINGGLILDIYQVVNQGWTLEQVRRIPLAYLISVELNDGTLPGTPDHDPSNRRFCGEGAYDLRGFIRCIQQIGYRGPWAVEVIAENVASMPLEEVCTRAYQTSLRVLELAASPHDTFNQHPQLEKISVD
jgi:sugar phosphate isomerase/epimerase